MSTPQPPRRRRIAGERRTPVTPGETAAQQTPAEPDLGTAEPTEPTEPGTPTEPVEPVEPTEPVEEPQARKRPRAKQTRPAVDGPARGGWWGSRASLVALTVALVVVLALIGLGLAGLLGNRGLAEIREAARTEDAEQTAPSVAERAAEAILAYDYRTLDADQDSAERFMTPAFVEKYSASFTKAVAPAARTYKAKVTSEVLGSSVVRATPDRVRVLVFVDQTTVATNKKTPQVALNRVEFDLVLRGGSWLVDDITSY